MAPAETDQKPKAKKLPKLQPRQKSQSGADAKPPKLKPREPAKRQGTEPQLPSLPEDNKSAEKSTEEPGKPRSDSSAPPQKATAPRPKLAPRPSQQQQSRRGSQAPKAQKPDEEQDLTTILSETQCDELTFLIAAITERMRRSLLDNFDPSTGLDNARQGAAKKSKPKTEDEKILNPDIDPGTVDVSAFEKEKKILDERQKEVDAPEVKKLKEEALKNYDEWRQVVMRRVGEAVNSKKEAEKQIKEASDKYEAPTKQQQEVQQETKRTSVAPGKNENDDGPKLEDIFPRIKTGLTKLSLAQRSLVIHALLLLLISLEHYSARSRVLLLNLTSSLKVAYKVLQEDEEKVAKGLLESAQQINADKEANAKVEASKSSRKWKVAAATAAGAAVVGLSGGMVAPMVASGVGAVMGGLGLGSTAAAGCELLDYPKLFILTDMPCRSRKCGW